MEAKRAELQRIMDAEGKHFHCTRLATKFFDLTVRQQTVISINTEIMLLQLIQDSKEIIFRS